MAITAATSVIFRLVGRSSGGPPAREHDEETASHQLTNFGGLHAALSRSSAPFSNRVTKMRIITLAALAALHLQTVGAGAQQQRDPVVIGPERNKCFDILELQKLNFDPDRNIIKLDYRHPQRGADYMAIVGWLQGFFSARNLFDLSIDGDFTQGSKQIDWMNWIFSYCQDHPANTLFDAGIGLSQVLAKSYKESRTNK